MVAVESKNSQTIDRGTPVLLAVDCPKKSATTLGKRGCGYWDMAIESVCFEVELNQTSCSREEVVHGRVCDQLLVVSDTYLQLYIPGLQKVLPCCLTLENESALLPKDSLCTCSAPSCVLVGRAADDWGMANRASGECPPPKLRPCSRGRCPSTLAAARLSARLKMWLSSLSILRTTLQLT
jgi:hypothetical protein